MGGHDWNNPGPDISEVMQEEAIKLFEQDAQSSQGDSDCDDLDLDPKDEDASMTSMEGVEGLQEAL